MKVLIFDSGPLINLSMNGLLDLLEKMKNTWDGEFVITPAVKYEVIDRPISVQRFELGAMRVQSLVNQGIIKMSKDLGIDDALVESATKNFMETANHALQVDGGWVSIVSEAEMSCLGLAQLLKKKGVESLIAVDERTTRVLSEQPKILEQFMAEHLHKRVKLVADVSIFEDYKFIRSSEFVYVAYKKGVLGLEGKKALEAALYATKYKGAAISFEEIDEIKKLG